MVNNIVLQGRLTRDPEIRYTQNDVPVASYTLAVERSYKPQDGTRVADFIPCAAWNKCATFARDYLHKGMMIIVEGTLQMRRWQDKDGNNRTTYEVIVSTHNFCESKRDRTPHPADAVPPEGDFTEISDDDGDVPF